MADDRAVALVAERGGRVVGLATVHILSVMNRAGDVAWLTALVVDESVRGTGVGRLLVKAVEDFVALKEQAIWGELRDILHLPSTDNDKNLVIAKLNEIRAKHYNDL